MSKNIGLAILIALGLGGPLHSFAWNPTISISGNFTATRNFDVVKSGTFTLHDRNVNFGFELTNKFYLNDDYFIKTGLRCGTFKTSVYGGNKVSSVIDVPCQVSWQYGFTAFTVPVHFGKEFISKGGIKGDFYAGLSAGVLTVSGATAGAQTGASANLNNNDTITTKFPDFEGVLSTGFLTTADFGAGYQPFKSAPGLRIGFMASVQLNKSAPCSFQASVSDSRGNVYAYDLQHQQQFTNFAFLLSYTFGNPDHRPKPRGGTHFVAPTRVSL